MVKYLKKSKMHQAAKELGYDVPAMKYCSYRFHRGAEWLTFSFSDESSFQLYHGGGYFSVEVRESSDSGYSRTLVSGDAYKEIMESL